MSKLQNIHNTKRFVYLFERDNKGKLNIKEDKTFYPYYYERDSEGTYCTYDNHKAKKITCFQPNEVKERRSSNSYEADILFVKRYLIDRIPKIEPTLTKIFYIDIEILTKDFPDLKKAEKPISCITIYNSFSKEYKTWFLPEWNSEFSMLEDFMDYIKEESPDVLTGWNFMGFDYIYLHNRINEFPNKISPISRSRYGDIAEQTFYPAGISVMDYMLLFKRIFTREQSYALDRVSQKHLKDKPWPHTDFDSLEPIIKEKNINDVERLVKLEEKFKVLAYYNEIRLFAGCLWEDLTYNSKILDIYILREARKRNIILPNKGSYDNRKELEGAYRRAEIGVFFDVYKADVASMYPNQLINFNLDLQNIIDEPDKDAIEIEGIYFKQDKNALLPYIARLLIDQKDIYKDKLKECKPDTEEHKQVKREYDARKALVNSLYGVTALPSFRLFNHTIASTITFLSRDLLKYVEQQMNNMDYKVHYTDTDSVIYKSKEDEIDYLNNLVIDWAVTRFNKPDININFESEGKFTKILILGKCHYFGYLDTGKGITKEIKGMEIKRSSSSKYESYFQEELINKILNKETKDDITSWVIKETERIKTLPILDLAFPCKIANKKYKNEPIFVRAYNNTLTRNPDFRVDKGELFYYVFVKKLGKDINNKDVNVIAINEHFKFNNIEDFIDWDQIIDRTVIGKAEPIFRILNWGDIKLLINGQTTLF